MPEQGQLPVMTELAPGATGGSSHSGNGIASGAGSSGTGSDGSGDFVPAESGRIREAEATAQALQSFLHAAVHELRTPVTTLKGTAQLARRRLERGQVDAKRLALALRVIDEQADRLTRLLAQVIVAASVARGQVSLNRAEIDLRDIADEVVQQAGVDVTAPKMTLAVTDEPVMLFCDEDRLRLALMALLESAARYAPGEPIAVELTLSRACETDGSATGYITVRTAGPGVPPDDRDLLVGDARTAVNGLGRAAGLGLYLCRQIVELHGGSIELGENVQGTSIVLALPLRKLPQSTPAHSQGVT